MRATFLHRTHRSVATVVLALAITTSLLVGRVPLARAADGPEQGIQVSPVIIDLNAEKGASYNLKLTVTNITAGSLVLTPSVNDFRAADETGNPKIILDNSQTDSTYSARSWVTPPQIMTLASKESRQITIAIRIPSNAEAGGHFGVIRFSGAPPAGSNDKNVTITASTGVLLLARVNGNISEQLILKELFTAKQTQRTSLFATGPVTLVTRIQNTGNVHLKPIGTLTVKDTFGKTVASYPLGSNTKNVLPASTRRYTQAFDKRWLFGHYTAELQAGYGTSGAVLMGSTSFWVIPFKLILFVIVLLVLLFFVFRKFIHRYNKHIVHRSQQNKRNTH